MKKNITKNLEKMLVILSVLALVVAVANFAIAHLLPSPAAAEPVDHTVLHEPADDIFLAETHDRWDTAYYSDGEEINMDYDPWCICRLKANPDVARFVWTMTSSDGINTFRSEGSVDDPFEKHGIIRPFPGRNEILVTYVTRDGAEHSASFVIVAEE